MDARTVRVGMVAGAAAGMMMAMFSMVVLGAVGDGFWRPVNLIAHPVWRGAPLGGSFAPGALVLGVMLHMVLSMMLGVAIAVVARGRTASAAAAVMIGIGVAAAAWVSQLIVWPALDQAASDGMRPWVFAVSHLLFGMTAGWLVCRLAATTHHSLASVRSPQPVG